MYAANVLADSVGPHNVRLTTLEITFPRPYLAEFNTHRMLSRNSESSRALPTELQIDRVMKNPYIPEFRERVKGMGGGQPLSGGRRTRATSEWLKARDNAVLTAKRLLTVAKDDANRVLEPFVWHTAIVTATDWDNFFNLRDHRDAALPMQRVARKMKEAMWASIPERMEWGGWHLPLVTPLEYEVIAGGQHDEVFPGVIFAAKVSAGRCARSSYSNHNKPETANESSVRWCSLSEKGHWSPGEHPAQLPRSEAEWYGVQRDAAGYEGNFYGWKQLRKFYPNEAVFDDAG